MVEELELIKVMLLARRKGGLTREEFREYYESHHAVLAASVMKKCRRYVRNVVLEEPSGPQDFDVVTEFWFDLDGQWSEQFPMTDIAVRHMLEADESRFMDRSSMRIVTVVERETDQAQLCE